MFYRRDNINYPSSAARLPPPLFLKSNQTKVKIHNSSLRSVRSPINLNSDVTEQLWVEIKPYRFLRRSESNFIRKFQLYSNTNSFQFRNRFRLQQTTNHIPVQIWIPNQFIIQCTSIHFPLPRNISKHIATTVQTKFPRNIKPLRKKGAKSFTADTRFCKITLLIIRPSNVTDFNDKRMNSVLYWQKANIKKIARVRWG